MPFCRAIPPDAVRQRVPALALKVAHTTGVARANYVFENNLKNHGDQNKTQSEQMANHIRATRTERAIEHYTGLLWRPAVGVLGGPDVGDHIQVRSKPYPPGGDLLFMPEYDAVDAPFVLVWDCGSDEFLLIGWLWGGDLRDAEAKFDNGIYKYVGPPYRHVSTLRDELNPRFAASSRTIPTQPNAPDHLWDW